MEPVALRTAEAATLVATQPITLAVGEGTRRTMMLVAAGMEATEAILVGVDQWPVARKAEPRVKRA